VNPIRSDGKRSVESLRRCWKFPNLTKVRLQARQRWRSFLNTVRKLVPQLLTWFHTLNGVFMHSMTPGGQPVKLCYSYIIGWNVCRAWYDISKSIRASLELLLSSYYRVSCLLIYMGLGYHQDCFCPVFLYTNIRLGRESVARL